jgi:DUF4097 and DUF4098 domain-containing protein YvlB
MFSVVSSVFVASTPAGAQTSDTQENHFVRTFTVSPGSTVAVENYKGTIHLTGADTNQISVTVDKKFEGSDSDRKWWMTNTQVNFSNDAGRVRVDVQYPKNSCAWNCDDHSNYSAEVDLTIQVPRRTNLELNGYKPDIHISAVEGDIHIKSYKSPIEIASTTGSVDIHTYKETVRLSDVSIRNSLRLQMEKGDVQIDAKTLGEEANIETYKGNIVLRIPRNTGLNVDYSGSRRSNLHSELPITSETGFGSGDVRGTINGGGTRLHLRTYRGSVSIESRQ